jgi:hypothetical protein
MLVVRTEIWSVEWMDGRHKGRYMSQIITADMFFDLKVWKRGNSATSKNHKTLDVEQLTILST